MSIGDRGDASGYEWNGYIQDLRVYQHAATSSDAQLACKYTSSFTPPTRNDWNVNNLTEAGSGSTEALSTFNAIKYTGNGNASRTISGVGFQPDFVWVKDLDASGGGDYSHRLINSVIGAGVSQRTNGTDAERDHSAQHGGGIETFTSDGFTIEEGTGNNNNQNNNGTDYIAWCWKAGGTASSNSDGSITSSVSANTNKSFSVVSYTGTGSNATVGHGLGKAPRMIIVKKRNASESWGIYHADAGAGNRLSFTNAAVTSTTTWNSTDPTDSVFSIGVASLSNTSGHTYVAYCFADVTGIVKVGSYTGNGNNSGPSVTTGFKPNFLLVKGASAESSADYAWQIGDGVRGGNKRLWAVSSVGEDTNNAFSYQNNGFTLTDNGDMINSNGVTYHYLAIGDGTVDTTELDVLNDTPTNYEDTDGTVHGNFCTLNPLNHESSVTLSQGNLSISGGDNITGTMGYPSSGKWYYEFERTNSTTSPHVGIYGQQAKISDRTIASQWMRMDGNIYENDSLVVSGLTSFNAGDFVGVAVDMDAGTPTIKWYVNNTLVSTRNIVSSIITQGAIPVLRINSGCTGNVNFGARPFKYDPPANHKALCTQNLDDLFSGDALNNPSKYFDVKTYSGTGNSTTNTIAGVGFQPDLIWCKKRSAASNHVLYDAIRGTSNALRSNVNSAESAFGNAVVTPTSTGFTITGSDTNGLNDSGSYVSWLWDAGTAAVTPSSSYDITPSAQWVNATAGFSITKYTGNGSESEVPHGLGAKPDMIVHKTLDSADIWLVYHIGNNDATGRIQWDHNSANNPSSNYWNNTPPTNTIVNLNVHNALNKSGDDFIMYAWTAIPNFSAFGSFEGNGNDNGPFIHLGFRPAYLMFKNVDATTDWAVYDIARDTDNPAEFVLSTNSNGGGNSYDAWGSSYPIDFLSNGFKIRTTTGEVNQSGDTIVYAAWAEFPFKTARAR